MNLEDVILRDTRANQPAATDVAEGSLYYVTDESVTERSNGTTWDDYSDGGGSAGITQLTGDVTAGPGSGSVAATIPNDTVTYAKIQNVSTTDRILGLDSAAPANVEEIPVSSGLEFTGGPGLRTTVAVRTQQIGITVDGGGSVVTSGIKGYKSFMVAGTITRWRLIADAAGTVEFDIQKSTYAGFPPTSSIIGSSPVDLAGVQIDEDSTLSGWTVAVAAGDVFEWTVKASPAPATLTRVTLELTITVT